MLVSAARCPGPSGGAVQTGIAQVYCLGLGLPQRGEDALFGDVVACPPVPAICSELTTLEQFCNYLPFIFLPFQGTTLSHELRKHRSCSQPSTEKVSTNMLRCRLPRFLRSVGEM